MVIVGLGNVGKEYHETHHNVGFMFVDEIAKSFNTDFKLEKRHSAYVACISVNGEKHYLLKPTTYMNLSGKAVKSFTDYYKIPMQDILVVSDDLDLAVSAFRIRKSGGAGGHKGLLSIMQECGIRDFNRLRIGIGRSENKEVVDFVLSKFSKQDYELIKDTLSYAPNIFLDYVNNGIDFIMNKYNGLKK